MDLEFYRDLEFFESYDIWLIVIGIAILATTLLPRLLSDKPSSIPMFLITLGFLMVALPFGLEAPNPFEHNKITERLTELGVIIALMGAGLKIDRIPGLKSWGSTWRLLSITMVLTIAMTAFVGWWLAAFVPATAMLLGAVIAPTDPVLAADVQITSPGGKEGTMRNPGEGEELEIKEEDEVRFALTSEAGLNDGLAFPFTYMAVAMGLAGAHPSNWIVDWLLIDVFFKLIVAVVAGLILGYFLGKILLSTPSESPFAKIMTGLGSLAGTLIIYGATEVVGGYGFIAVFIGAVALRNYDRKHHHHESLHIFAEKSERILIALILLALGGAVAGGLLVPLTWTLVLAAVIIVFVIRPVTGMIGLIGFDKIPAREKFAISFFGIRGIGSLYYLSYGLNQYDFPGSGELWALVTLIVIISIFLHGISASPVIGKLDVLRKEKTGKKMRT